MGTAAFENTLSKPITANEMTIAISNLNSIIPASSYDCIFWELLKHAFTCLGNTFIEIFNGAVEQNSS